MKPERQKTDTNVYAVFSIQTGRPATEAEKASAKMWLALVKTNQYKADDSDIVEPVVVAAPVEKPAVVVGKKGKSANDIY